MPPGDDDIAMRLAKLEADFEEQNHQLSLAVEIGKRRERELAAKDRENQTLRLERDAYFQQARQHSSLLQTILESRSFRAAQALRRLFGRE